MLLLPMLVRAVRVWVTLLVLVLLKEVAAGTLLPVGLVEAGGPVCDPTKDKGLRPCGFFFLWCTCWLSW